MITGLEGQFVALEKSPFQFHLTGSHALGGATETSDWDFFVQKSDEVERWLRSIGFNYDHFAGYNTSYLVMMHGNIHIQLVDDFNKKLNAQNAILHSPSMLSLLRQINKTERKFV